MRRSGVLVATVVSDWSYVPVQSKNFKKVHGTFTTTGDSLLYGCTVPWCLQRCTTPNKTCYLLFTRLTQSQLAVLAAVSKSQKLRLESRGVVELQNHNIVDCLLPIPATEDKERVPNGNTCMTVPVSSPTGGRIVLGGAEDNNTIQHTRPERD